MTRAASALFGLALLVSAGCSNRETVSLEDAIIHYRSDGASTQERLGVSLLSEISLVRLSSQGLRSSGTCLFYADENTVEIVHPENREIENAHAGDVMVSCSDDKKTAVVTGRGITVYGGSTGEIAEISTKESGDRIKAILASDGRIYYYQGHQLFYHDPGETSPGLLVRDRFSPPNRKYYQVNLLGAKNTLAVVAGSAGYYYISAVDTAAKKTLVTNIASSSSSVAVYPGGVYYLYGGSGSWDLLNFNFTRKSKKRIRNFKDLKSIELTESAYIFRDSAGLWVQDYDKDIVRVPFEFDLFGKYGGLVLLESAGNVYAVDLRMFMEKLEHLKLTVPELFD